jgi:hypothetical protein
MTGGISISDATATLKCLRELLLASYYLTDNVRRYDERIANRLVMANAMARYIFALDLFLTDSVDSRNIEKDSSHAVKMMTEGKWDIQLSDNESSFTIVFPSASDPQTIKAHFPDRPKNAKAYHRWQIINTPDSFPTEFGPPDSLGREIHP